MATVIEREQVRVRPTGAALGALDHCRHLPNLPIVAVIR